MARISERSNANPPMPEDVQMKDASTAKSASILSGGNDKVLLGLFRNKYIFIVFLTAHSLGRGRGGLNIL